MANLASTIQIMNQGKHFRASKQLVTNASVNNGKLAKKKLVEIMDGSEKQNIPCVLKIPTAAQAH